MPIPVQCPNCGTRLSAPDAAAGKRVKCAKCATPFPVPVPDAGFEVVEDAGFEVVDDEPPPPPVKAKPAVAMAIPAKALPAKPPEKKKPPLKTRDDEDDEEDERPRKKPKAKMKRSSSDDAQPPWKVILGVVLTILVLVGAAARIFRIFDKVSGGNTTGSTTTTSPATRSTPAPASDVWVPYSGDGFSCEFPGGPPDPNDPEARKLRQSMAGNGIASVAARNDGGRKYVVVVFSLPAGDLPNPGAFYDTMTQSMSRGTPGAQVTFQADADLAGLPGREVVLSARGKLMINRMALAGGRLVMAIIEAETGATSSDPKVARFLASIRMN